MTVTIPVCAGVARSRISKIDVRAERGLNVEAVPLNVAADVMPPNGAPTGQPLRSSARSPEPVHSPHRRSRDSLVRRGHDTRQELTCNRTSTSPAHRPPRRRPVGAATAAAIPADAAARVFAARSVTSTLACRGLTTDAPTRLEPHQDVVSRLRRKRSIILTSSAFVNGCQPCGFIGRPYSKVKFAFGLSSFAVSCSIR